jgi:hypothetical protein
MIWLMDRALMAMGMVGAFYVYGPSQQLSNGTNIQMIVIGDKAP